MLCIEKRVSTRHAVGARTSPAAAPQVQAPLCSPLERRKRLFTVSFGACLDEAGERL